MGKLQQQQEQEEEEYDEDDEDDEKIMSAEEGDGFAGAIYSGSRFRGASQVEKEEENAHVPDDEKYEQMEAPPAAYSDYGSDMEQADEEEHFGDLEPEQQSRQESIHSKHLSVAIEAGKVKNAAAKLAIDPTAMLPGASAPKIPKSNASEMAMDEDASAAAALSRPAAP